MISNLISGLIGSNIGGLIAGYCSLKATENAELSESRRRAESEAQLVKSLLQALHDELETAFTIYQDRIGAKIEALPEGALLDVFFPVMNDYFVIFNTNAFLIGRIENNDLRRSLIQTYVMAKGLVDSFRMNNDMLSKFEHLHGLATETGNPAHKQNAKNCFDALVLYAAQIKKGHLEARKSLVEVMRMLHKQGVLNEVKSLKV